MGAASTWTRLESGLRRPVGRVGMIVLTLVLAAAPAVLLFDPVDLVPRSGHIGREPRSTYQLFSDDVAYVAGSRTWSRTFANLFVPHNTHIVPAWRLLTGGFVAIAGNLERIPDVLAVASYAILVAVMLMTGRVVAVETGSTLLGFAAMCLAGTTSLMLTPVTWYSAGQPLWAGLGILATLWYAQCYRRSGRRLALVAAAVSAPVAGWLWTMGHMAGPVAAVYLWTDGRRRCRLAAWVPLAATIVSVALGMAVSGRQIDSRISFHGRSLRQAFHPIQGAIATAQAIPENLVCGNLGLSVRTTPTQGAVLTLGLIVLFGCGRRKAAASPVRQTEPATSEHPSRSDLLALQPLECAGAALLFGTYLVEWSFRGYESYANLRTINLRFIVPWYDAIPHVGAVLFLAGWFSAARRTSLRLPLLAELRPLSRRGALGVCALALGLIVLGSARVGALVRASVPPMLPSEREWFVVPRLQTIRANFFIAQNADRQRAHLRRLERAEEIARRLGLSRDDLHDALGHPFVSGTVGLLRQELFDLYDAVGLLDLPEHGRTAIPAAAKSALEALFALDPEPRPDWILPSEPWPPPSDGQAEK
jgi:hypothetical protein